VHAARREVRQTAMGVSDQLRHPYAANHLLEDRKHYVAVYSGYGGDARGMQGGVTRVFPCEYLEVPEGGAVWVFALP
jgi:hypothetical protein